MKFVATDTNGCGVTFTAPDWSEAAHICEYEGWTLDGEWIATIPGDTPQADVDGLVDQLNRGGLN